MSDAIAARKSRKRPTPLGVTIGLGDGVPIPAFMRPPAEIDFLDARLAIGTSPGQFVSGFIVDKQESDDLCWAAVSVSAARFRNKGTWTQRGLVDRYHEVGAGGCQCTAQPGDGGMNLWCVNCAFEMINVPYKTYSEAPWFTSLGTAMSNNNPVCVLRNEVPQDHYVVVIGTFVSGQGRKMVRITDPDKSQPGSYDVDYQSLISGPEAVLAWYQF